MSSIKILTDKAFKYCEVGEYESAIAYFTQQSTQLDSNLKTFCCLLASRFKLYANDFKGCLKTLAGIEDDITSSNSKYLKFAYNIISAELDYALTRYNSVSEKIDSEKIPKENITKVIRDFEYSLKNDLEIYTNTGTNGFFFSPIDRYSLSARLNWKKGYLFKSLNQFFNILTYDNKQATKNYFFNPAICYNYIAIILRDVKYYEAALGMHKITIEQQQLVSDINKYQISIFELEEIDTQIQLLKKQIKNNTEENTNENISANLKRVKKIQSILHNINPKTRHIAKCYELLSQLQQITKDNLDSKTLLEEEHNLRVKIYLFKGNNFSHPSIGSTYIRKSNIEYSNTNYNKALEFANKSIYYLVKELPGSNGINIEIPTFKNFKELEKRVDSKEILLKAMYLKLKSEIAIYKSDRNSRGKLPQAARTLDNTLDYIKKVRESSISDMLKLRFNGFCRDIFELMLELIIILKNEKRLKKRDFQEKCFEIIQLSKSPILNSILEGATHFSDINKKWNYPDEKKILNNIFSTNIKLKLKEFLIQISKNKNRLQSLLKKQQKQKNNLTTNIKNYINDISEVTINGEIADTYLISYFWN